MKYHIKSKISPLNSVLSWIFVLLFVLFLFLSYEHFAHAETKYYHYVIEWSETCKELINLGDLETCGDPEIIKQMYSPPVLKPNYQKMFDDMAEIPKAKYQKSDVLLNHRHSCVRENYCNVFENYYNFFYWYDPDKKTRGYYDKIITIHPSLKHTNLNVKNQEVFVNDTKRELILDTNQINIKSCRNISYTPENYRIMIEMGSIMWYISDNCTDENKLGVLKEPYKQDLIKTPYSPLDSPEWKILQEAEALKDKYKGYMIGEK